MSDRVFDIDIGPGEREGERTVIEVSVYYSKGGINYFSYKQEPRGYYVMVQVCNVGRDFRSYTIGISRESRDFKQVIIGCKRLNRKHLQFYRDAVELYTDRDELQRHIEAGNKADAFVEIMRAIERMKEAA